MTIQVLHGVYEACRISIIYYEYAQHKMASVSEEKRIMRSQVLKEGLNRCPQDEDNPEMYWVCWVGLPVEGG